MPSTFERARVRARAQPVRAEDLATELDDDRLLARGDRERPSMANDVDRGRLESDGDSLHLVQRPLVRLVVLACRGGRMASSGSTPAVPSGDAHRTFSGPDTCEPDCGACRRAVGRPACDRRQPSCARPDRHPAAAWSRRAPPGVLRRRDRRRRASRPAARTIHVSTRATSRLHASATSLLAGGTLIHPMRLRVLSASRRLDARSLSRDAVARAYMLSSPEPRSYAVP